MDESALVVGLSELTEGAVLADLQFADGTLYDEMISTEEIDAATLHQAGLDDTGLSPEQLGGAWSLIEDPTFPSIPAAKEMCATGHNFNEHFADVFDGEVYVGEMRERHVRCARCSLTFSTIQEHGIDHPTNDSWLDGTTENCWPDEPDEGDA